MDSSCGAQIYVGLGVNSNFKKEAPIGVPGTSITKKMLQSGVGSMQGLHAKFQPPTLLRSYLLTVRSSSSTYHNALVDLIFVRTANIPNLSLLTYLEVY